MKNGWSTTMWNEKVIRKTKSRSAYIEGNAVYLVEVKVEFYYQHLQNQMLNSD